MPPSSLSVRGLGGVFLFANDPLALSEWYSRHLGLAFLCWGEGTCYGLELPFTDPNGTKASLIFSIQKANAPLPEGRREVGLNWRVDDLEAFLAHLAAAGVGVEGREDSEYGRFAWVMDPEGHRLELYEPPAE